jgi:predicted RND superfamily exporter protein
MVTRLLRAVGHFAAYHTRVLFGAIILITIFFGILSTRIRLNMNMNNLLPEDEPIVKEYNLILEEFEGTSNIIIVAQGEPDDLIAYMEYIVPLIRDFDTWIENESSDYVRKFHEDVKKNVEKGLSESKADGYFRRVDY